MTTRSWVRRLLARAPRRAPQGSHKASARFQPRRVRLCLEALEDRVLPTLGFPIWLDEGPGPRIQSGTAGMISQQNPTTGAVNEGTVTFTVKHGSTIIGTATTSDTVSNGQASVNYVLPADTAAATYTIDAEYNPGHDFTASIVRAPARHCSERSCLR